MPDGDLLLLLPWGAGAWLSMSHGCFVEKTENFDVGENYFSFLARSAIQPFQPQKTHLLVASDDVMGGWWGGGGGGDGLGDDFRHGRLLRKRVFHGVDDAMERSGDCRDFDGLTIALMDDYRPSTVGTDVCAGGS